MMHREYSNPKLTGAVQKEYLSEFLRILTDICEQNGKELVIADRWYPLVKIFSFCGNIRHYLKLTDRTYKCDVCCLVMDRDENLAGNLENCPKTVPKSKAA